MSGVEVTKKKVKKRAQPEEVAEAPAVEQPKKKKSKKAPTDSAEVEQPKKQKAKKAPTDSAEAENTEPKSKKRGMISLGNDAKRGLLTGLVEEKAEEVSEPAKVVDPNYDKYEVFVDGVPYDWSIQDIRDLFGASGNVVDVRAPSWHDSGRLRGYAHVQYDSLEAQQQAIKKFHMYYVTEKRYFKVTEAQAPNVKPQGASQKVPEGCKRCFVKNLPYDATESEIAGLVGGKRVLGVRIVTQQGRSKGFAYVDFRDHGGCVNACELAAKGLKLRGRVLRVDFEMGDARAGFHYRPEAYETRLGPKKHNIKKTKERKAKEAEKEKEREAAKQKLDL